MAARNVYVQMSKLPSFSKLNEKVKEVERAAPWWELYGVEWVHVGGGVGAAAAGLLMLQAGGGLDTALGFILLGFCHTIITQKAGHLAAHGALARSKRWNKFWCVLFVEFLGGYSEYMGYAIHIKCHHPHTNIIGLGDSSSWKLPGLSRVPYMFLAPLLLPILLPLVSLQQLLESKAYWAIAKFIPVTLAGIAFRTSLFMYVSGYTMAKAFGAYLAYQAVFAINYIHINIFQVCSSQAVVTSFLNLQKLVPKEKYIPRGGSRRDSLGGGGHTLVGGGGGAQ